MATDPRIKYDIEANAQGGPEVERLAQALEKVDRAIDPEGANRARQLADELRKLAGEKAAVDAFLRSLTDANEAARALENAQQAADRLAKRLQTVEAPTRAEAAQLEKLREAASKAQRAFDEKTATLNTARTALDRLGIAETNLGTTQDRLAGSLTRTRVQAREVVTAYEAQTTAAKAAAVANKGASDEIEKGLEAINSRLGGLANLGIGTILGSQTAQLVGDIARVADEVNNLAARMRLVTGEGEPLRLAMAGVQSIALSTGTNLADTGMLFTRILEAGRELKLSQTDALELTKLVNQSIQLGGASAESSKAALTQFIQSLQSGVFRGEEFNSVMEQAYPLAKALADGLGVTTGQLRGLAEQGKLTAQVILPALLSQGSAINKAFEQLPQTVGRALENLRTRYALFVAEVDKSSGFTEGVAKGIEAIANNLDTVARVAAITGAALTANLAVAGAQALRKYAAEAALAAGATNLLTASISKVPAVVNITIAAVGLEVGYEIGKVLYENSELARKLGIAVTEFFTGLVNDVKFVKEAAAAIFTDDTIGAAFDRYKARAEAQRDIFQQMYSDAAKSPEAVRAAADAANAQLDSMGTTAKQAGATVAAAGAAGAGGVGSVGTAAANAEGAIAALVKGATAMLPLVGQSAREQAAALAEMAKKGGEAAAKIGEGLTAAIEKLSGAELVKFRDAMVGALKDAGDQSGLLQQVLVETGARAAQALGVDVAKAAATMSKEFVTAEENLALLVRSTDSLRKAGIDTGQVLEDALRKMAEGAKNQTEFDALRVRIEALGKAGQLSKAQVTDLLNTIRDKADDARKGINSLAEAFRFFGIASKDELQKTADTARQAWELVRGRTELSIEQQQAAFKKYADAAIAANGGVVDSTIRAQAQALKLGIEFDATGKAIGIAMGNAKKAIKDAADAEAEFQKLLQDDPSRLASGSGLGGINGNTDRADSPRLKGLANPIPSIGDEIRATKSGEVTRTLGFQLTPPDNSGNWEFDTQKYIENGSPIFQTNEQARVYWKHKPGTIPTAPGGGNAFGGAAGAVPAPNRPAPAPAPSQPTATPSSAEQHITVRLDFGTQVFPVQVTSRASADALLSALETAKRLSGH